MRVFRFLLGLLVLFAGDILRVYWIMPFPGSQVHDRIDAAYFLHHNLWWIRLVGLALIAGPFVHFWRNGRWPRKVAIAVPVLFYALVFYLFHFKFMADKMFLPPHTKMMASPVINDSTANKLVLGVVINDDARAYPIELIGYHHQVLDTVGGEPVLVTYCTVCHTGRAYSPKVNGQQEIFRLVGMDHFDAMFEDSRTGSWWRQVNGECIAGPLKGQHLNEIPSAQFGLGTWTQLHPNTLVFQPDTLFRDEYAGLKGYDNGTIESSLERRDSASWQMKSWVIGVERDGLDRAYDWNDLRHLVRIHDTLNGQPITVALMDDSITFRAWTGSSDSVGTLDPPGSDPIDPTWDIIRKALADSITKDPPVEIPTSQEFWHSWRTFHPNTTRYTPK